MRKGSPLFYGWVIVGASFIWFSIAYGVRYSFSVFYPAILDDFGWSRAGTASILSVNMIVYGLTAPLAGTLVDRFGPRRVLTFGAILLVLGTAAASQAREIWQFYLTYGVLTAAGTCMAGSTPTLTILSNWFIKRRGAAVGIFSAGTGLSFVYAIFVERLIFHIGWPATYLVLAATVALIVLPLVALIPRPRPQDMGLLPDGDKEQTATAEVPTAQRAVLDEKWASTSWTLPKAVKTYRFWTLFFAFFCTLGIGWTLVAAHQVKFLEDAGSTRMFAAIIYGLYGVMFVIGNLCGFISDRIGRETAFTVGSIWCILGVFFLLLVGKTSAPWLPFLYAIAFGLGMGICLPTLPASATDLFQGKNFGSIMGSQVLGFALGGFLGPWLGGWIYDVSGSYTSAFILVIVAFAAAVVLLWIASPGKIRPVTGKLHRATRQPLGP